MTAREKRGPVYFAREKKSDAMPGGGTPSPLFRGFRAGRFEVRSGC